MSDFNDTVGVINNVVPDAVHKPETKTLALTEVPDSGSFDAVIIGGGPAGMTAGVYLARKMINTLIISTELGGQVLWTSNVENYPGYDVISGFELAMKFKDQLLQNRINIRDGDTVVALKITDKGGIVRTDRGAEYSFKSLIAASGKRSRNLEVPGEKEFYGRGVTYCATCDGPLYRGEKVTVIGGGNSGLTAAIDLLSLGCTVDLVNFLPGLQADAVLVEKAKSSGKISFYTNHQVDEITGGNAVTGIKIHDRETGESLHLEVSGVFIEIGLVPNSSYAEGVLEMNEHKEIIVTCLCETNVPGIFAAGDVTTVPDKQIIVAAGEGAKAALGVSAYLMKK